ncbi:hypothetical protein DH2020_002707 [Rehmannia glutinosa]|uniref:C3H1-type domain-containing protein n=1 Tax=Rehmannia glutinosa TaxID=99300 RepID=A0ABR0XUP5_REHGL
MEVSKDRGKCSTQLVSILHAKEYMDTSGCSFGDACHFLHYFPGYSAHAQLANLGGNNAVSVARNANFTDGLAPTMKTKICNKINTPEGCRYGDKCHFAHSEMEISKPPNPRYNEDSRMMGQIGGGFSQRFEPSQPVGNFGASATAKISIDAAFAGAVIGKNGVNSKQICRQTGVKLSIKDHETDTNQRNIELEGTFDQIKEASSMVRHLMMNISARPVVLKNPWVVHSIRVLHKAIIRKKCVKSFPRDYALLGRGAILLIRPVSYDWHEQFRCNCFTQNGTFVGRIKVCFRLDYLDLYAHNHFSWCPFSLSYCETIKIAFVGSTWMDG